MPYCTQTDLINSFGTQEIIDLTNLEDCDAIAVNTDKLNTVLGQVDSEINGYIGRVVAMPVTDIDTLAILNQKATDIARYRLESKGEVREDVRKRYEDAIEWLKAISSGEILLDGDGDSDTTAESRIGIRTQARVFTRKSMTGYTDPWYR